MTGLIWQVYLYTTYIIGDMIFDFSYFFMSYTLWHTKMRISMDPDTKKSKKCIIKLYVDALNLV